MCFNKICNSWAVVHIISCYFTGRFLFSCENALIPDVLKLFMCKHQPSCQSHIAGGWLSIDVAAVFITILRPQLTVSHRHRGGNKCRSKYMWDWSNTYIKGKVIIVYVLPIKHIVYLFLQLCHVKITTFATLFQVPSQASPFYKHFLAVTCFYPVNDPPQKGEKSMVYCFW